MFKNTTSPIYLKALILVLILGCSQIHLFGESIKMRKEFLGEWTALSRTHMSILGELKIKHETLHFTKAGTFRYKVVSVEEDRLLLKLERMIDESGYVGIGPIEVSKNLKGKVMDLSLYKTKESGLVSMFKGDPLEECSLWGVYLMSQK